MKLTYDYLRSMLEASKLAVAAGMRTVAVDVQPGEGHAAALIPGSVTIHDHPSSGRPLEIHFMVDGIKIAEIGPPKDMVVEGITSDVAGGYIDLLAEWDGRPVHHKAWQLRILADNDLADPDRETQDRLAQDVLTAVEKLRFAEQEHAGAQLRWEAAVSVVNAGHDLARAVLDANYIHPSYSSALFDLEGRDQS